MLVPTQFISPADGQHVLKQVMRTLPSSTFQLLALGSSRIPIRYVAPQGCIQTPGWEADNHDDTPVTVPEVGGWVTSPCKRSARNPVASCCFPFALLLSHELLSACLLMLRTAVSGGLRDCDWNIVADLLSCTPGLCSASSFVAHCGCSSR